MKLKHTDGVVNNETPQLEQATLVTKVGSFILTETGGGFRISLQNSYVRQMEEMVIKAEGYNEIIVTVGATA